MAWRPPDRIDRLLISPDFAGNRVLWSGRKASSRLAFMTSITTQTQHFPGRLTATRDGIAEPSPVLASCDPRTPATLTVHLATLWATTTLSLPELERLVRMPTLSVILGGEPGRGAISLPTVQIRELVAWLQRLDAERTHPHRNLLTQTGVHSAAVRNEAVAAPGGDGREGRWGR
jgi:hypothetical protein